MKILTFAILCFTSIFATPVTHTYFAEKYLNTIHHNYSDDDITAFFLGVLFPDIHYLQVLPREATHLEDVYLEDVMNESSPFFAGQKLHCLIDEVREAYAVESGVFDAFTNIDPKHMHLYLKMLEDESFYDLIDQGAIGNMVYYVHDSEEFGLVSYNTLKTWHRVLGQYFSMRPSTILRRLRQFSLGFFGIPKEEVAVWSYSLTGYLETEAVQNYMTGLEDQFDTLFEQCNGVSQTLGESEPHTDSLSDL
ncbi:MAG: hypothetical protein SP1CHLAM54_06630 [Chlamydiia bacterium]|nr:hypothetical protein [Chlamydiia bacterium]MCH9615573.1 hypothetical protein [Chlamydiia bacterium]MCH9629228.1 hypothetical protein [Chlamydiia bacterium]